MKQTDRVPHKARGAAQSAGVPAESAGTTKTSYPLMKYLSLLLAVALLFSGVTFARYLSNDRIDSSVGIARFDATYSIDRVNSTTFGNQNYWIETGNSGYVPQGENTAITVGITLKNNGDTSVQPTLHFEGPKEYWDHIALQLTTARNVAMGKVLTPQLVIGDIMNAPEESGFNTQSSKDYGSLGDEDATLALSDSVVDVNYVRTATWTVGEGANAKTNKMTITKKTDTTIGYSVGFARKDSATGEIFPPIFVDCQKQADIYSIDLELPALNVAAKTEEGAATQDVVVWLTWTTALANTSISADRAFWGFDDPSSAGESELKNMKGNKQFTFNNQYVDGSEIKTGDEITVLGYHYDVPGVPVVDESGETTTVRVKKTFASEDGTTEGTTEGKTEYFHVASINNEDGSYVHPFEHPVKIEEGTIYQCTAGGVRVKLSDVDTSPDFSTVTMVASVEGSTVLLKEYAPVHARSFGISFRATFVQSSEVPKI